MKATRMLPPEASGDRNTTRMLPPRRLPETGNATRMLPGCFRRRLLHNARNPPAYLSAAPTVIAGFDCDVGVGGGPLLFEAASVPMPVAAQGAQ